ncbi:AAA family ATPase [Streptomyces sp. MMBL 11-3]|uniref:AAA family ATPase n=1 Tax=Streptomyces sp. MMBL 11-3 TaxID=3382639 RepID=UPI0039B4284F
MLTRLHRCPPAPHARTGPAAGGHRPVGRPTTRMGDDVPETTFPSPALVVLLGPAGSGKSTAAAAWPCESVLELDTFRALLDGDPPDADCPDEAVHALAEVAERRLARRLTTVVDIDHTEVALRAKLLCIAERHGVPAVALVMTTPLRLCLERNALRPAHLQLPEDTVREQYGQALDAVPGLCAEGFVHVEALYGGAAGHRR